MKIETERVYETKLAMPFALEQALTVGINVGDNDWSAVLMAISDITVSMCQGGDLEGGIFGEEVIECLRHNGDVHPDVTALLQGVIIGYEVDEVAANVVLNQEA